MKKALFAAVLAVVVGTVHAQQQYAAWSNYREITINTTNTDGGANVTDAVTDFPVLVRLTNANAASGSDVLSGALANGADIRFSNANGTVALPYEIERWSASAAEIWVRVPTISGNANTTIRMYWGRSGATSQSNGSAVFGNNGFIGVWHMGNATGAAARPNAVSPGFNDAIPAGNFTSTMTPRAGAIGLADSLRSQSGDQDGADHFDLGVINFPNQQITVSFWAFLPNPQNFTNWTHFFSHGNGNLEDNIWIGRQATTNNMRARGAVPGSESGNETNTTITNGLVPLATWMYVGVTKDSTNGRRWRVFRNGEMAINYYNANDNHNFNSGTRQFNYIARSLWPDRNFHFVVDEYRLSSIARSPAWMKLEFETTRPGGTAVTLGTTQSQSAPALAYLDKSPTYIVGAAITNNTAVVSGAASGFSIAPSLPAGLSINASNGTISGTPTAASASTQYVVTATVGGNTARDTLHITVVTGTPPGQPSGVTATPGNAEATVTWAGSAPGSAPITSYVVRAVQDTSKSCTWTTGPLSCTVTGLTNGTSYTFTVRAVSSVGPGQASDPSAAVIPATRPSAPTSVQASVLTASGTSATATVSWTAPASNGGLPITGTFVFGTPTGACFAPGAATSCTVGSLAYGTAYTFRAAAGNSLGIGDTSEASAALTPSSLLPGTFAIHMTGAMNGYSFVLSPEAIASTEAFTMSISDIWGRTVWSKTVHPARDNTRELSWNGRNTSGQQVSAGMYLVRVSTLSGGTATNFVQKTVSTR